LEARTDTGGNFRFDLGDFRAARIGLDLRAHSPRYRFYNRIVEIDEVELPYDFEIDLEPGVLARGRVGNESGEPLPDVMITHQLMPMQSTMDDGTWEVFGLATPRDRLQFGLDGYVRESLDIETPSAGVYEGYEIILRSARVLNGQVVTRADQPVPRALLRLYNRERYLTAHGDEEGRFESRALPSGSEGLNLLTLAEGFLPSE